VDIVQLSIPLEFIRNLVRVSWRDLRFGLVSELLDPQAPVEWGREQIARLTHPPEALIDLVGMSENCPSLGLVDQLAEDEPEQAGDQIRDKWLYLVLVWIYEHKDEYPDSLQRVEEVYGDFDYPEQMANFVRNMPMTGPDLGSIEANERRLFKRWKQYIGETAPKYAP